MQDIYIHIFIYFSGRPSNELEETNFIDDSVHQEKQDRLPYDETYAINTDDIFQELIVKPSTYLAKLPSKFSKNATSQGNLIKGINNCSGEAQSVIKGVTIP